jgi:isoquinoline 1-oxidoreductase beta subunit
MNEQPEDGMSRRAFLKVSVASGVGVTVAVYLAGCGAGPQPTPIPQPKALSPTTTAAPSMTHATSPMPEPTATPGSAPAFEPNIYLTIDSTGTVTVRAFRTEMGQAIHTAIAMILAEELDVDMAEVHIEPSPVDKAYGDQVTGGSVSVSRYFLPLRQAGAAARDVLLAAAAQTWAVDKQACRTEASQVIHPDGQQRLAYGDLVWAAAGLPLPPSRNVSLKDPKAFRVIGTSQAQYYAPAMAAGSALYAGDVRLPGMLCAVVARCPVFGGKVAEVDDAPARAVPGVRDVVAIDSGLAVVAESTWAALRGRAALQIVWDEGKLASASSESIHHELTGSLKQVPGSAAAADPKAMDAAYDIPYLAHVPMEPPACVADVRSDGCDVWASSQDPQAAKRAVAGVKGLPSRDVTFHMTLAGGAFGRRHAPDYILEAVQVSLAVSAPVKLFWSREDDLQHDRYHPLSYNYIRATLDGEGRPPQLPDALSSVARDVPTGYWRSVEQFPAAFARESFVDEIAAAGGLDPVALRIELAPERGKAVIQLAAEKAAWGSPLPDGWGRGIAYFATFGVTHVAHVVELSVAPGGQVRVRRVVCAVDCGLAVNPDGVAAQMEGGIVFGLTATLKPGITIQNGRVQQSNFHDHPLLRMDEMPVIEVYIVPSDEGPSGTGEMAVPPIAPAVANAIHAATGKRVRHIPILAEDLA